MMTMSEQSDLLWKAFIKAKQDVTTATRDSDNEDDGFRYASLGAVRKAIRYAMERHALTDVQRATYAAGTNLVTIHLTLIHDSGQSVSIEPLDIPVAVPYDARAVGEAITYGRKYQLATVFGVTTDAGDVDMTRKETADEMMEEAIAAEIQRLRGSAGEVIAVSKEFDRMSKAQQLVYLRSL